MADEFCYTPLQVCALRVAKLTNTGAPDPGVSNGYISDALIQADLGIELEEGDDFTLKNGCGSSCATFKDCDKIKRATIEMELCQLDSELLSLLIGGTLFSDSGDTIGMRVPQLADACPNGVSLELWSKAWNGSAQATPDFLGGSTIAYFHWVLPKVQFQLGDVTLENEFVRIPVTGFGEENENLTIDGPYNDWQTGVAAGGGVPSALGWFLDDTLPTAQCGFVEVPATS